MNLARLRLANWKAFRDFELSLSASAGRGDVVIVEGKNGFGKTSLLEAMAMGLYGRDGYSLVGRVGRDDRATFSYDGFLERALSLDARGRGATMSVELGFVGRDDRRIVVQRNWYFTASGRHRPDDEEVRIWTGPDEDLVTVSDGEDPADFLKSVIANELIPERLAAFFLFDGEQIDRLAGHSVEAQVRAGVEAALGTSVLRTLKADLDSYAREARRGIKHSLGTGLDAVTERIAVAQRSEEENARLLGDIGSQLEPLRTARDEIVAQIGALSGESYANFKQLFEQRERSVRTRDEDQEQLRRALSSDLALALAGPALRERARQTLRDETNADRGRRDRQTSDARFRALVEILGDDAVTGQLLPSSAGRARLRARLQVLWEATGVEDKAG